MENRKFNRGNAPAYPAGERLPERLALMEGGAPTELSWLSRTERGAVVFVMSAGCEACDLSAAAALMLERPELDYLLLAEAGDEQFASLKAELEGYPCTIERCDISAVAAQTPIKVIPFMLVLNREGTVVGSGLFNTAAHATALALVLPPGGAAAEADAGAG